MASSKSKLFTFRSPCFIISRFVPGLVHRNLNGGPASLLSENNSHLVLMNIRHDTPPPPSL